MQADEGFEPLRHQVAAENRILWKRLSWNTEGKVKSKVCLSVALIIFHTKSVQLGIYVMFYNSNVSFIYMFYVMLTFCYFYKRHGDEISGMMPSGQTCSRTLISRPGSVNLKYGRRFL